MFTFTITSTFKTLYYENNITYVILRLCNGIDVVLNSHMGERHDMDISTYNVNMDDLGNNHIYKHNKMKDIILTISCLCIGLLVGWFVGSHDIYMAADVRSDGTKSIVYPHAYNVRKALKFEREYANALFEGLHRFYSNDDNDAWFDLFIPTPEYQKIDSLNGGDWEDFYFYETPQLSYQY